jgi:PPOX class probable F420-dependent enzyme
MNRRQLIALSPAEQAAYLSAEHTIILTTLDRHGYPHAVAMWYVVDDAGRVVMTTFRKSQKVVNVQRDPRCALLLETGRTYPTLKGVLIRGRAEIVDDVEQVLDVLERVNVKYHGAAQDGMRDALRTQATKRIVLRVHPERISSWDHSKLGGVY